MLCTVLELEKNIRGYKCGKQMCIPKYTKLGKCLIVNRIN